MNPTRQLLTAAAFAFTQTSPNTPGSGGATSQFTDGIGSGGGVGAGFHGVGAGGRGVGGR